MLYDTHSLRHTLSPSHLYILFFYYFQIEKGGSEIKCVPLDGQLGKIELMGSQAFQLLQKILHPVTGLVVHFSKIVHFYFICHLHSVL